MSGESVVSAIGQGKVSGRAMMLDSDTAIAALTQHKFSQHQSHQGWVEHGPEQIWPTISEVSRGEVQQSQDISIAKMICGLFTAITKIDSEPKSLLVDVGIVAACQSAVGKLVD